MRCEILQTLENGQVSYIGSEEASEDFPVDTTASFMCDYGYSLNGSNSSVCQTDGNWDPQSPTCDQSIFF